MKLSDQDLVAICEAELSYCSSDGDLADERAESMDYYLGDISSNISSPKDRSGVVTRDVLDTVESVLPSLMRIFVEAENAVEFIPEGKEDEESCKRETDAVRSTFYDHNDGFLVLYSFIKDALISKNGIMKVWWEEPEWEREEYKGLNELELQNLLSNELYKFEIIGEPEQTEEGVDITLKVQKKKGKVVCDVITPEEFGISKEASSPNPKAANFSYHKCQKTVSDLIEAGYDRKLVEELPTDGDVEEQERLARRHLSDEQETSSSAVNKSMRLIWVTECYIKIDRNDDGIAELLKVTLASVGSGSKLLDVEEVDRVPFIAATPIILTHKFYGLSLADLIKDIQEIRSVLTRGILDNMYLANNVRMGVNENVNLDDLLTSRPGGVVRTKGKGNPGEHMMPIVHPSIPPESFGLLEVLDNMQRNRTGVGDEVMGLDSDALANINTGVIAQAYDAARMRIELMARIIAEIGLKELFKDIRELLHKNQDNAVQLKYGDEWVDVYPAVWRDERRCKVTVGLGHHTKERKLMASADILALQEKAKTLGYDYVTPEQIHNAISDRIGAHGLEVETYFSNPATYQPPEQPPNPALLLEAQKLQLEERKVQIKEQEVILDNQVKMAMAQSKEREQEMKTMLETMKGEMDMQRMAINEQSQIMNANTEQMKANHEVYMSEREQEWKEVIDTLKLEMDKYKADLNAEVQSGQE
jgi:hypothetical protein